MGAEVYSVLVKGIVIVMRSRMVVGVIHYDEYCWAFSLEFDFVK